jgi:hypothetical protein
LPSSPGIIRERHITGSDRAAARHPAFRWANTMLANIKNSLLATHRVVDAKTSAALPRRVCLALQPPFYPENHPRASPIAATATPPMPYRLLKLAEARW